MSIQVGEGESKNPLIPDISGLTAFVKDKLEESNVFKENYMKLISRLPDNPTPTIEGVLSHLRSLLEVVMSGNIDSLNKESLENLDAEICRIITEKVSIDLPKPVTPYHQLATWVGGIHRTHPIEIFTPNYDMLIEQAFEAEKIPYFDGFVGSRQAFFDLTSMENDTIPHRWARLWKVHGSVNWWKTENDEVIRRDFATSANVKAGERQRQMIYPSHLKYDQSRRMPYLAMLDRLRSFLAHGQSVLVTNGYSFADQHLNEVILHGLRSNPSAVCFGLLFEELENHRVLNIARGRPNLSILAPDGAVLGTIKGNWKDEENVGHPMHGLAVRNSGTSTDTGSNTNRIFSLGDFKVFGDFLAQQFSQSNDKLDDKRGNPNAP